MTANFRRTILTAISIYLALAGSSYASTIAITEFIIDPLGGDADAPEWIELFNYGSKPVDIGNWTLKDNANSIYSFPAGFTIPSGGYAIATSNREVFKERWLNDVDDPRVAAGNTPFVLNNTAPGDGIYLRDSNDQLIWSFGYQVSASDPINQYRATFLTIDDFSATNYGEPPQHGTALIDRNGTDGTGTLGYEDNNITADPHMYASSNGSGSQQGSPLLGHYTAAPEPSTLAMLALATATSVSTIRRRK